VLALVYLLHAQSKLDAVGDVQPVEGLTAKLSQTPVVLPTV